MSEKPASRHVSCPTLRRVVLLGASNLTRGFPHVLKLIRESSDVPLDVRVAMGLGRSYGMRSRVLARSLPGILECGLWDALGHDDGVSAVALLTDIGNDVLYGESASRIASWVETCLDRLQRLGARLAMTQLPLASLERLTPRRYFLARTVLFPSSRLSFGDAVRTVHELSGHLERVASERRIPLVVPCPEWYGYDLIHLRRAAWREAWSAILEPFTAGPSRPASRDSSRKPSTRPVSSWTLAPERRWILGVECRARQPARCLADGSLVSAY